MMKIKQDVLSSIISHSRKVAPIEACGYLGLKDGVVCRHYELTNIDQSEVHFSFDPKEQFDVVKKARAEGLELNAVYHSHPASPARPSKEDIRLAYDSTISYVIVSLANGKADVQSFKIVNGQVDPEIIEVIGE